jgi:3',5'-cyclic-AMP phosphodiesterase
MLIAQISDTHIKQPGSLAYGRVDTERMLRDCVAHVMAQNPLPDVVVITGDLVDFGQVEEYELLKDCLAPLTLPLLLIAGNHDERQNFRQVFSEERWAHLHQHPEFVQFAVTLGQLRFVGLDTLIPFEGGGMLCERRLAWLDETLAASDQPTVILMHHAPFLTGIVHMDAIGLTGRAAFAEVVAKHPHVCRILCGHLHRPIQACVAGVLASTAPSPAHQVLLGLLPDTPDSFVMEPPGYQLHLWRVGQMVSHQVVLGDFAGPYPFREDGQLIQ